MKHIFVVNTSAGKQSCLKTISDAISQRKDTIDYEIITPSSADDNIEKIKSYLESHKNEEVRFYACGGDGTANKVATGIFGHPNASMTILAYGSGNDYVKYYENPEHFRNIDSLVNGEEHKVDIMKVNDKFALNATHFGFDGVVAKTMDKIRRKKIIGGKRAYPCAVAWALLTGMKNRCSVYADGVRMNENGKLLLCTITNGRYVGGSYKCAPRSINDDGLMEVCLVKPVSKLQFLRIMGAYTVGKHLDDPKYSRFIIYRRAKKVEIEAPEGFCISIDGEIYCNSHIVVENEKQAIRFISPRIVDS